MAGASARASERIRALASTRDSIGFAMLLAALLAAPAAPAQQSDETHPDADAAQPTDRADLDAGAPAPKPLDPADSNTAAQSASAQPPRNIESILVMGTQSNLFQDQPISSMAFDSAELKSLRIENISDLADYMPNLEIKSAFAASNPTIFIRGIGLKDYNANAAGAVAVYQDGINLNSPAIQLGQLFDIESIEVLRGPQGSLYGRNAPAGAIAIHSALPDGSFGISTDLTYGNYDAKQIEAAIDVPLLANKLSMRISGTANWRDGYTRNHCSGWDPTRFGFPRVDEASNRDLYDRLIPTAAPVKLQRGTGGAVFEDYAYLDIDTIKYINDNNITTGGIAIGNTRNPIQLAEPVTLPNGDILPIGTRVGLQANVFQRTDVDGICMITGPGQIATPKGAVETPNGWTPGEWLLVRPQPTLEDFAGLKSWTNNIDNWASRMILLFEPIDNMEWTLTLHGGQNRGDSAHLQMLGANGQFRGGFEETTQSGFSEQNSALASGYRLGEGYRSVPGIKPDNIPNGEGGGNPFAGFYSSDGREILDAWGASGRGVWDLGPITITLLTDYEWYDRVVQDEGDANPLRIFEATYSDRAWQTDDELRVEREGNRYHWIAGFFFLYEDLRARNFFPNTRQYTIDQHFAQTLSNWAPYLHTSLDLVERGAIWGIYALELSTGIRYNRERKEFTLASSAVGTDSGVTSQLLPEDTSKKTWAKWTGEATLSYTPFQNAYGTPIVYVKYSRGFKGGHFNAGLTTKGGVFEQSIDPVKPEYVNAAELGIRSRWLDDRLTFNAAIFRYWYQNLQVFDIANNPGELPLRKLFNGDADVRGAEVELRAEPIPRLQITGTFGWLDSEFGQFLVEKTLRAGSVGRTFNYEGHPLLSAPRFSTSAIFEYAIRLGDWGFLVPHWDFNYRSKVYLDPQQLDPISQDGYWLHNLRLSYRTPDERISLAFWVANLFDKHYKIEAFDLSRTADTILEVWGEPRTYGVTLSLAW